VSELQCHVVENSTHAVLYQFFVVRHSRSGILGSTSRSVTIPFLLHPSARSECSRARGVMFKTHVRHTSKTPNTFPPCRGTKYNTYCTSRRSQSPCVRPATPKSCDKLPLLPTYAWRLGSTRARIACRLLLAKPSTSNMSQSTLRGQAVFRRRLSKKLVRQQCQRGLHRNDIYLC
jgi:hypothetical protein